MKKKNSTKRGKLKSDTLILIFQRERGFFFLREEDYEQIILKKRRGYFEKRVKGNEFFSRKATIEKRHYFGARPKEKSICDHQYLSA